MLLSATAYHTDNQEWMAFHILVVYFMIHSFIGFHIPEEIAHNKLRAYKGWLNENRITNDAYKEKTKDLIPVTTGENTGSELIKKQEWIIPSVMVLCCYIVSYNYREDIRMLFLYMSFALVTYVTHYSGCRENCTLSREYTVAIFFAGPFFIAFFGGLLVEFLVELPGYLLRIILYILSLL